MEEGFKDTSHPRILAATLLSDWVFSQHPKSVHQVIDLILDGLGLRYLLTSSNRRFGQGTALILPPKCGNEELVSYCFSMLQTKPPMDYEIDIVDLIKANSSVERAMNFWMQNVLGDVKDRGYWLQVGLHLGLLSQLDIDQLHTIMSDEPTSVTRLSTLLRGRRGDYCSSTEELFNSTLGAILAGVIKPLRQRRPDSILDLISHVLDPARYSMVFDMRHPIALQQFWASGQTMPFEKLNIEHIKSVPLYTKSQQCLEVAEIAIVEADRSTDEWASDLTPWDNLVEKVRSLWGDSWAVYQLANTAAGIKSTKETCIDATSLFETSKSLCRRARYARLRSGSPQWWHKQADLALVPADKMFLSLLLLNWASSTTLLANIDLIGSLLDSLTQQEWITLISSLRNCTPTSHGYGTSGLIAFNRDTLPPTLSLRAATAFALRAKQQQAKYIYKKYLSDYDGVDPIILEFCQREALDLENITSASWSPNLELIARSYSEGATFDTYAFQQIVRRSNIDKLPLEVAEQIVSHADHYPGHLVPLHGRIDRLRTEHATRQLKHRQYKSFPIVLP